MESINHDYTRILDVLHNDQGSIIFPEKKKLCAILFIKEKTLDVNVEQLIRLSRCYDKLRTEERREPSVETSKNLEKVASRWRCLKLLIIEAFPDSGNNKKLTDHYHLLDNMKKCRTLKETQEMLYFLKSGEFLQTTGPQTPSKMASKKTNPDNDFIQRCGMELELYDVKVECSDEAPPNEILYASSNRQPYLMIIKGTHTYALGIDYTLDYLTQRKFACPEITHYQPPHLRLLGVIEEQDDIKTKFLDSLNGQISVSIEELKLKLELKGYSVEITEAADPNKNGGHSFTFSWHPRKNFEAHSHVSHTVQFNLNKVQSAKKFVLSVLRCMFPYDPDMIRNLADICCNNKPDEVQTAEKERSYNYGIRMAKTYRRIKAAWDDNTDFSSEMDKFTFKEELLTLIWLLCSEGSCFARKDKRSGLHFYSLRRFQSYFLKEYRTLRVATNQCIPIHTQHLVNWSFINWKDGLGVMTKNILEVVKRFETLLAQIQARFDPEKLDGFNKFCNSIQLHQLLWALKAGFLNFSSFSQRGSHGREMTQHKSLGGGPSPLVLEFRSLHPAYYTKSPAVMLQHLIDSFKYLEVSYQKRQPVLPQLPQTHQRIAMMINLLDFFKAKLYRQFHCGSNPRFQELLPYITLLGQMQYELRRIGRSAEPVKINSFLQVIMSCLKAISALSIKPRSHNLLVRFASMFSSPNPGWGNMFLDNIFTTTKENALAFSCNEREWLQATYRKSPFDKCLVGHIKEIRRKFKLGIPAGPKHKEIFYTDIMAEYHRKLDHQEMTAEELTAETKKFVRAVEQYSVALFGEQASKDPATWDITDSASPNA